MLKLRGVAFERTELGGLRAAVKLPESLKPEPSSARLALSVEPGDGSRQAHGFALQEVVPGSSPPLTGVAARAGERVFVYRINPAELPRLEQFRREILARRANASQSPRLSLSVAARACRETELPSAALLMTTYLATPETDGFVALTHDVDLRTLAGGNIERAVPPCPR
jgi:hypothetical protein